MNPTAPVVVVGAGPAGALCAHDLGRAGRDVILLDKSPFPRDKVCGDAVAGRCFEYVSPQLKRDFAAIEHAAIDNVVMQSPRGDRIVLANSKRSRPGFICKRIHFDRLLFDHAKAYAEVIEGFRVTGLIEEEGFVRGVRGIDASGEQREIEASIVIGADGANSVVARELGFGRPDKSHEGVAVRAYYRGVRNLEPLIELLFLEELHCGYFWIFPTGGPDNEANVGLGLLKSEMKDGVKLKDLQADLLGNHPEFQERFSDAEQLDEIVGWSIPFGSKPRPMVHPGCLLLGDAASLVNPMTGEGIGHAITCGALAARYVDRGLHRGDLSPKALRGYERDVLRDLRFNLKLGYFIQRLGRHRPLLNLMLKALEWTPPAQKVVERTFFG